MVDYVSERVEAGLYEVKMYHPSRVRVIKECNLWYMLVYKEGKWFRYARAFNSKDSALNAGVGFLRGFIESNSFAKDGSGSSNNQSISIGNKLSRSEAAAILGVASDASADVVKAAYNRLLRVVHPDLGGSTFLAQQVNAAKEVMDKR